MEIFMIKQLTFAVVLTGIAFSAQAGMFGTIGRTTTEGSGTTASIGFMNPQTNWGFQIGAVFNSEFSDKEVNDYPVPHSSYRTLGEKRTSNTIGVVAIYFLPVGDSVKVSGSLGFYMGDSKEIAQSNVTGWYYNQGDKSKTKAAAGLGLHFGVTKEISIGVGYHSILGTSISIGQVF